MRKNFGVVFSKIEKLTFLRGGPLANAAKNSPPRVGQIELKIASRSISEALKAYLQGQIQ